MLNYVKNYFNNRITLTKLEIIESLSGMISNGIYALTIAIFSIFLLLLGSLAFGFFLGKYFDSTGFGFLAVAGIYFILIILFLIFRRRIKSFLMDITIESAMVAISNQEKKNER